MSGQPLVSIVLPTFNGARHLAQSVQSCLEQTWANVELIIVDDCSTDETPSLIGDIKDPRVVPVRHERNQGLPQALNTGFRQARGQFLTWTSDDNWYAGTAIESLLGVLEEHPQVGMVYSDYWSVDGEGNVLEECRVREPDDIWTVPVNRIGPSFLYRREVYQLVGDYDPRWRLVEDYDYWLRIAQRFPLKPLHEPLYYYRYHEESLTSAHSRYKVRRKLLKVARHYGILSISDYVRRLGDTHVDAAFFFHQKDMRGPVILGLCAGILQNPSHIRNLGVWSILLEAVVGKALAQRLKKALAR